MTVALGSWAFVSSTADLGLGAARGNVSLLLRLAAPRVVAACGTLLPTEVGLWIWPLAGPDCVLALCCAPGGDLQRMSTGPQSKGQYLIETSIAIGVLWPIDIWQNKFDKPIPQDRVQTITRRGETITGIMEDVAHGKVSGCISINDVHREGVTRSRERKCDNTEPNKATAPDDITQIMDSSMDSAEE